MHFKVFLSIFIEIFFFNICRTKYFYILQTINLNKNYDEKIYSSSYYVVRFSNSK